MTISSEIHAMALRLCATLDLPAIAGLHLPAASATDDAGRDEFGFVFLEDGSAAPFYVSLPGTLAALWERFPRPAEACPSLHDCLAGLTATALAERTLAIGAWNAVSQYLMRRAGFRCPPRARGGADEPRRGERVGMVGYFCPVVDRLVAAGVEVLVVERQPQRVPERAGVLLSTDPASLSTCRVVYCTASTLINDSLEEILGCRGEGASMQLIGPSGSGLPDAVFAHGVDAVGGVSFADVDALRRALERGESWGPVGQKYELTAASYPGIDALIDAASSNPAGS